MVRIFVLIQTEFEMLAVLSVCTSCRLSSMHRLKYVKVLTVFSDSCSFHIYTSVHVALMR